MTCVRVPHVCPRVHEVEGVCEHGSDTRPAEAGHSLSAPKSQTQTSATLAASKAALQATISLERPELEPGGS
jgi:hypothetical protein